MNIGNVLKIAQMALNAAPSEVAVVHGVIQAQKTGGTAGLLGSILTALPEEIDMVSTIIAAIHANNQTAAVAATPNLEIVKSTRMADVIAPTTITATESTPPAVGTVTPPSATTLRPSATEIQAQLANQGVLQKPS